MLPLTGAFGKAVELAPYPLHPPHNHRTSLVADTGTSWGSIREEVMVHAMLWAEVIQRSLQVTDLKELKGDRLSSKIFYQDTLTPWRAPSYFHFDLVLVLLLAPVKKMSLIQFSLGLRWLTGCSP